MHRPCGHLLTDRAAAWCAFAAGEKIVDAGCGNGDTVRYAKERYGLDAVGLDKNPEGDFTIRGDAAAMPFGDDEVDGVFFKCSFSVMEEPARALQEARRILKPGGWLVIDDFYARGAEKNLLGISRSLGRIESLETITKRLRDAGFTLSFFEDHTRMMRAEWARAIFEGTCTALMDDIAAHKEALREAVCGYGLFIVKKDSLSYKKSYKNKKGKK